LTGIPTESHCKKIDPRISNLVDKLMKEKPKESRIKDDIGNKIINSSNPNGNLNQIKFYFIENLFFSPFIDNAPTKIAENAISLLEHMLQLNPKKRISSKEALKHSYLELWHDSDEEPDGELLDESFENQNLEQSDWKSM
jgi:serine/threonine protein kinase